MRVIYICGPYSGNFLKRLRNIWRAREAAIFVWLSGGVALCPHLNTAFFERSGPYDLWVTGDLDLIARCDAVWCIEGWEMSRGSMAEIAAANRFGKTLLFNKLDVVEYLRSFGV